MRICAYCRVSTERDEQQTSFINQQKYYNSLGIKDIYADEITATGFSKRDEFIKMLEDCGLDVKAVPTSHKDKLVVVTSKRASKYDYIYCKSNKRFSRNVAEALDIIETLKTKGVYCKFELEAIDTSKEDYHVNLGIVSVLAENESRALSESIRWGHARTKEQGKFRSFNIYGYDYNKLDKSIAVNEEESRIVKYIYKLKLDGLGARRIVKVLTDSNIMSRRGKPFNLDTVQGILKNKTYCGYTRRGVIENRGFGDKRVRHYLKDHQYVKSDLIACLVSEEDYNTVQSIFEKNKDGRYGCYRGKTIMSGKIKCPCCGYSYVKANNKYACGHRNRKGKAFCSSKSIDISIVEAILLDKSSNLKQRCLETYQFYKSVVSSCIKKANSLRNMDNINMINHNKQLIERYKANINSLLDLAINNTDANDMVQNKINDIGKLIEEAKNNISLLEQGESSIDNYINNLLKLESDLVKYINELPERVPYETYIVEYVKYITFNKGHEVVVVDIAIDHMLKISSYAKEYISLEKSYSVV